MYNLALSSRQRIHRTLVNRSVRPLAIAILVVLVCVSVSKAESIFMSYSYPFPTNGGEEFGKSAAYGYFQAGGDSVLVIGAPGANNNGGGMYALYTPFSGPADALSDTTQFGELGNSVAFSPKFLEDNGQDVPVFVGGAPDRSGFVDGDFISNYGSVFQYRHLGQEILETEIPPQLKQNSNNVGYVVAACDFNGDGFTDIAVGSNQSSNEGHGHVYVSLGGDEAGKSFLIIPDYPTYPDGKTYKFGLSIADAGDLTGNGCHELLISHEWESKAYLIFGRPYSVEGAEIKIEYNDDGSGFNGISIPSHYCQTVAGGIDITGDSQKDIVITEKVPITNTNQIKIYSGPYVTGGSLVAVSTIHGGASFGDVLALGGDVNGDSVPDLLVGCPNGSASDTTSVYFRGVIAAVLGGDLPEYLDLQSNYFTRPDIWFVAPRELDGYEYFGSTVGFMDDQDGDGKDDIFVGAPGMEDSNGHQSGKIYGYSLAQSDKISITNLTPTILANGVEDTTLFSVAANHISGLPLEITMTAADFFTDPVVLDDNGDGTYSHSETGLDVPPGEYDVEFFAVSSWAQAVGGDGAFLLKKDTISAVSNNVIYTAPADPKNETNLKYQGTPYSSVAWNFNNDEFKDLFITITDSESKLYSGDGISTSGVPSFDPVDQINFEDGSPQAGLLGVSVGDLDLNDDHTDLFAAHVTDSRLYRWTGSIIKNIAFSAGVDAFGHATSGSWGDFNGDSHLDLFITRAEAYTEDPPNYGSPKSLIGSLVLTNVDDGSGGRSFSTTPGSGLPDCLYSTNATWCDFDEDGDADLFVGALTSSGAGASKLFLNDGGVFIDQTMALLGSTSLVAVVGSAWEDMNSDGKLDLVLVRHGDKPLIYFNDAGAGFGDGAGGVGPMAFGPSHGFSSMVLYDYNNDGYRDFLGLPNDSTRAPQLFQNISGVSGPSFVELPESIGLDDVGYVHGAVAADFGGPNSELDGLTDLYLGRLVGSGAFFFKCEPNQPAQADFHFTGIRLVGAAGLVNKSGIGAEVKIQKGSLTQIQVVDGGSMRGSQSYSDLAFGLGEGPDPVTATITWPNGIVQEVATLSVDILNVINYPAAAVVNSSVTARYVVKANGLVDWVFTWETDGPSVPSVDEVHFSMSSIPQRCLPYYASITDATPGVTLSYSANPDGGYTHEMTWANRDCVPTCLIPFYVESGYIGQTDVSDTAAILRVKICAGF